MDEINFQIERDILAKIKTYCELNEISDINGFINKCLLQGFSIVKYGISPSDNSNREHYGIKEFENIITHEQKKDLKAKEIREQDESNANNGINEEKKEVKPVKEGKESIKTKKIRVIKKG